MRAVLFVAFAFSGCATAESVGERAASATTTMAIGGGFVATGAVATVGGLVTAGFSTTLPEGAGTSLLIGGGLGIGLGLVQIIGGALALQSGSHALASALDGARGEDRRRIDRASKLRDEAAASKLEAARRRIIDACADKVCASMEDPAACLTEMKKAGQRADDVDEWLTAEGCSEE